MVELARRRRSRAPAGGLPARAAPGRGDPDRRRCRRAVRRHADAGAGDRRAALGRHHRRSIDSVVRRIARLVGVCPRPSGARRGRVAGVDAPPRRRVVGAALALHLRPVRRSRRARHPRRHGAQAPLERRRDSRGGAAASPRTARSRSSSCWPRALDDATIGRRGAPTASPSSRSPPTADTGGRRRVRVDGVRRPRRQRGVVVLAAWRRHTSSASTSPASTS